jgi:hypothetical protein
MQNTIHRYKHLRKIQFANIGIYVKGSLQIQVFTQNTIYKYKYLRKIQFTNISI